MVPVSFTGGVAGASSSYKGAKYAPDAAFDAAAKYGWMSGRGSAGKVPQLVFYTFATPQIIAKAAFKPRQDCRTIGIRLAPTEFEIVASNGAGAKGGAACDAASSEWVTLAVGAGKMKSCGEELSAKIPQSKRAPFRCIGIRVLDTQAKKVALARVRMWKVEGKETAENTTE